MRLPITRLREFGGSCIGIVPHLHQEEQNDIFLLLAKKSSTGTLPSVVPVSVVCPAADAAPLGSNLWRRSSGGSRRLMHPEQGLKNLIRGGVQPPHNRQAVPGKVPQQKREGEPAMLNNFNKEPVDYLDLDDVKVGFFVSRRWKREVLGLTDWLTD